MNKRKTPRIRFKGFTDDWEQRKLSELVAKYEDPVETPHGGYIRLGIRSHAKGTFHEYVEPGHELETAKMHRVATNKLIFNITFAWEHAVAIANENDAGKLVSHRFPQFTLLESLRPEFLKYVILDEGFHHNLYLASPGGAGRNRVLKIEEALDYPIYYPSLEEQHKIGGLLNKLNDLITLHQRKLEKLKIVKKAMLENCFPKNGEKVPRFRFSGFTGDWEQRKLGEIYARSGEKNDGSVGIDRNITVATMQFKDDVKVSTTEYLKTYYTFNVGDIAFEGHQSKEFRFGRFVENDIGNGIVSHIFAVFRPIVEYDLKFWKYAINNERLMQRVLSRSTKASTMMHDLVTDDFLNESFLVPTIEEQRKIGDYFSHLDHLITLHQRKLEKLKLIKKSFLEKMFV